MDRKQAQIEGFIRYNDGSTCINGHQSERYTSSGTCCECVNESNAVSRGVGSAASQRLQTEIRGRNQELAAERLAVLKLKEENKAKKLALEEERIRQAAERKEAKAANAQGVAARRTIREEEKERQRRGALAAQNLVSARRRVPLADVEAFRQFAFILAVQRNPDVLFEDVTQAKRRVDPCGPDAVLVPIASYSQDIDRVEAMANQMYEARGLQARSIAAVAAEREERTATLTEEQQKEAYWPEGDPR